MTISTFLVVVLLDVGASNKPSISSCPSIATFTSSADSSANIGSSGKTLETEDAAGGDEVNVATGGDEEIDVNVGASGKSSVSSAMIATFISSLSSDAAANVGTSGNEETEDIVTDADAV